MSLTFSWSLFCAHVTEVLSIPGYDNIFNMIDVKYVRHSLMLCAVARKISSMEYMATRHNLTAFLIISLPTASNLLYKASALLPDIVNAILIT